MRYVVVFALRSLGPVAGDALPSLIKCLKDPEITVQSDAIVGLGEIHQEPARVIPIVAALLANPQNPQHSVRQQLNPDEAPPVLDGGPQKTGRPAEVLLSGSGLITH
jgi:HEAT repeat protein